MTIYDEVREQLGMDWDTVLALMAVAICGGGLLGVLSVVMR